MKEIQKITLLLIFLLSAFVITSFAQECEPKEIKLDKANYGSATISGKTGGCNSYGYALDEGDGVKVTLTSADGKARFSLADGNESDPGYVIFSNLTTTDKIIKNGFFVIDVKGTAGIAFTLKVSTVSGS